MTDDQSYHAFEAKVREAIDQLAADVRVRAEVEADQIRRTAATEAARILADTERRRNELLGEIQRLERQLAQVSTGIQALLQGHGARAAAEAFAAPAPPSAVPSVMARPRVALPPSMAAPIARPAPEPEVESEAPARPLRPQPAAPPAAAPPAPRPEPPLVRPRPIEPPPPAPPPPAPPAAEPAAAESTVGEPAEEVTRTEVAVSGTPSFARALELQRGIQRCPGVRHVQALQFERGTLVLAVEHEMGADLIEAVQTLPNVQLQLVGQSADRLEFSFA